MRRSMLAAVVLVACSTAQVTTTTTTSPTTTATAAPKLVGSKVYFFLEGGDRPGRLGPFLAPVYREVEDDDLISRTVVALLQGPTPEEFPPLSSAIPTGTALLGVEVAGGLATIDLSPTFDDGGGSFSMFGRLAQVVFTLTQFEEIDSVGFELNGESVEGFSSEGIGIDHSQTRGDYQDLIPMLLVDEPAFGAPVANPMVVSGVAAAFEGTFDYAIVDAEGLVIAEGFITTDSGIGWGSFNVEIPYAVEATQRGALIVSDVSAESGQRQNIREYPVTLRP